MAFPTTAEARLVDALRAGGHLSISLVAQEDEMIVGHVAMSPVTVAGARAGLGLGPVAVVPERQQRGIGHRLISQGLAVARGLGMGLVVVLGKPAYYGRFGFKPAAEFGLTDEYGGGQAFQVLELRPGAVPRGAGLVQYAAEFALVA